MPPHAPSTGDHAIRVALVEDDDEFQRTLLATISDTPDIGMCGIATTLAQGLALLEQPPADVLIVDLGLPDGSGIDVIRLARQKWPACHSMVSTTFGDEGHVIRALEAGAYGYLLKDSSPRQLVDEIRNLHAGGSPVSPLIARLLMTRFHQPGRLAAASGGREEKHAVTLSAREHEVLAHITKGFTANEIADFMAVSYHTVQTYVRRIYEKLNVNSRSEAIFEARHQGLLRD
jgi:DNA-binding NarL/FixJ family response regulator